MIKSVKVRSLHWILMSILMISAVLCFARTFPARSADATTAVLFVDPAQTVLTSAPVGTLFRVNVTVANVTGLAGLEFILSWDPSLLSCTTFTENLYATVTPAGETSNIWKLQQVTNNTAGYVHYAFTYMNLDEAISLGYCPINITQANFPPDGKLAAAVLTFNVTKVPPANSNYSCNFTLSSIKPSDIGGNPIPMTSSVGYYQIYGPPETLIHNVVWNSTTYIVTTVSNVSSVVVPGSMMYVANYTITFNVTGAAGTTGYINVTIPKSFIRLANPTDAWNVTVNGTPVTPTVSENSTHTSLYFTTTLGTKTVTVVGTVPEFPVLMVIPLLMIVTLVAVGLRRRRRI